MPPCERNEHEVSTSAVQEGISLQEQDRGNGQNAVNLEDQLEKATAATSQNTEIEHSSSTPCTQSNRGANTQSGNSFFPEENSKEKSVSSAPFPATGSASRQQLIPKSDRETELNGQQKLASQQISSRTVQLEQQKPVETTAGCANVSENRSFNSKYQQQELRASLTPVATALTLAPPWNEHQSTNAQQTSGDTLSSSTAEQQNIQATSKPLDAVTTNGEGVNSSKMDEQPEATVSSDISESETIAEKKQVEKSQLKYSAATNASSKSTFDKIAPNENISHGTVPCQSTPSGPSTPSDTSFQSSELDNTPSLETAVRSLPGPNLRKGAYLENGEITDNITERNETTSARLPIQVSESSVDFPPTETPPLAVKPVLQDTFPATERSPCESAQGDSEHASDEKNEIDFEKSTDADHGNIVTTKTNEVKKTNAKSNKSSAIEMVLAPPFNKLFVKPRIQSLTPFRYFEISPGSNVTSLSGQILSRGGISPTATGNFRTGSLKSATALDTNNSISTIAEHKTRTDVDKSHFEGIDTSSYDDYSESDSTGSQNHWERNPPGFSPPHSSTSTSDLYQKTTTSHSNAFVSSTAVATSTQSVVTSVREVAFSEAGHEALHSEEDANKQQKMPMSAMFPENQGLVFTPTSDDSRNNDIGISNLTTKGVTSQQTINETSSSNVYTLNDGKGTTNCSGTTLVTETFKVASTGASGERQVFNFF